MFFGDVLEPVSENIQGSLYRKGNFALRNIKKEIY
jgi:hypothetical protein